MRKIFYPAIMSFALMLLPQVRAAENLVKNSNLSGRDMSGYTLDADRKHCRFSVFTEDLTWNQCARLDFLNYRLERGNKKSHLGALMVGGAKSRHDGREALVVKPATTYEFRFDARGTVKRIHVSVPTWKGACAGKADEKIVYTSLGGGPIKVNSAWSTFRGTFTTGPGVCRAALRVSVYWREDFGVKEPEQAYLLLDNFLIREKKAGLSEGNLPPAPAKAESRRAVIPVMSVKDKPVLDGKLDDPVWEDAPILAGFTDFRFNGPVAARTEARVMALDDALWIGVRCLEPNQELLHAKYRSDADPVFRDDCVEVFLDRNEPGITLRQFVVGAGGGRFMGWGNQVKQPKNYGDWQARVSRDDKGWSVEMMLPYKVLGWQQRPGSETTVGFNICRERRAVEKGRKAELSNWNFTHGNFHNRAGYGLLAFGDLAPDAGKRIAAAQKALAEVSADIRKEIVQVDPGLEADLARLAQSCARPVNARAWERIYRRTGQVYEDIKWASWRVKFRRVAKLPFVVTTQRPTDDVSLPLMPDAIFDAPGKIECFAAINEYESLPVVITNLSDRTETFRVIVFGGMNDGIETAGLQGAGNAVFPAGNIVMREALRVRDSDEKIHGMCLDPLPRMNQARTISVPPRDSGIVWITFRVQDVQPGRYRGTLRVIPLGLPGKFRLDHGWKYSGAMKDLPISLTVWPIHLPREPGIPLWLMARARNESFFRDMIEHGNRVFQLTPWYFLDANFNVDGSIRQPVAFPRFDLEMKKHLAWAKKYNAHIRFLVGFSAYSAVFKNQIMKRKLKDKFRQGSAEWQRAYMDWCRAIADAFARWRVDPADYVVEVWDEPDPGAMEEILLTLRLAREAAPKMRLQVTFGHRFFSMDKLSAMEPYVDVFCPYGHLWSREDCLARYRELQAGGRQLWFYNCAEGIRLDKYTYYRLHAWKGLLQRNSVIGIFNYVAGPGGYYGRGSWKLAPIYALVSRSFDEPVPSIRYECLREGMDDIKYIQKLRQMVNAAKAAGNRSAVIQQAEIFLQSAPGRIIRQQHQHGLAGVTRAKAAELIMKLTKLRKD